MKESSPYTRLTELFNVNHFIISLARPYLAPLISNDLKHYHNSYGKVRYNHEGNERNNMKSKFNNQILIDENKPPYWIRIKPRLMIWKSMLTILVITL